MDPRAARVHPQQALAVYAESLATGRRVVVFGDPATGLGDRLEELGARTVVVVGPGDDLEELRGATFDLALVADLGLFDDAAALLARVRRVVGETGVALVAAANRDAGEAESGRAFDYYALFDLVAKEFADVRMIAQLPFHGVALAELGDEDDSPAVSVDTQLADPDRAPQAFVALASQRGAGLDPYAIVELPSPEGVLPDTRELEEARADLEASLSALAQERVRGSALEAQIEALRAQASRVAELEQDVGQLEKEVAARARQLAELSNEVEEMRSAAEAGRIAAAEIEELALRADRAERAASLALPELARVVDAHAEELGRFEEALRERAQAVRALEGELARRERMVRELVDALDEHAARAPAVETAPPVAPLATDPEQDAVAAENLRLRERLDALALELARREGEAQATAWTVAELERRLAQAAVPAAPAGRPDLDRKLAAALDELDALRLALTQEHDARVRAESGEELTRAREEIQRQAVLLEQLGRELRATAPSGEELR
jgi:hypothetical protein